MSRFSGPQGRGAARRARETKRTEAEARADQWESPEMRLLHEVFQEPTKPEDQT